MNLRIVALPPEQESGWTAQELTDFIDVVGGITPSTKNPEYWGPGVPWLSVADFNTGERFVSTADKHVTVAGVQASSANVLEAGDLIMSARGTVGVVAQLTKPMAFNQSCYGIKAKSSAIDKDFLYFLVKWLTPTIAAKADVGVFAAINRDAFKDVTFQAPRLNQEKHRIAKVLSTQESIVSDTKKLIELLETRFRYFSRELLSGRMRIKELDGKPVLYKNEDWKEVEVNGVTIEIPRAWSACNTESTLKMLPNKRDVQVPSSEILASGRTPVISQDAVLVSGFSNKENCIPASKDNPFIVFGDHTCIVKLVNVPFLAGADGTQVFNSLLTDTRYLYCWLGFVGLKSTGYSRHFKLLKETHVAYPTLDEQLLVVQVLDTLRLEISQHRELLALEEQKFKWLLNNLMTGKYLVEEVSEDMGASPSCRAEEMAEA